MWRIEACITLSILPAGRRMVRFVAGVVKCCPSKWDPLVSLKTKPISLRGGIL